MLKLKSLEETVTYSTDIVNNDEEIIFDQSHPDIMSGKRVSKVKRLVKNSHTEGLQLWFPQSVEGCPTWLYTHNDITDVPVVPTSNVISLYNSLIGKILDSKEIDTDHRLYPRGDNSFGDFIPGKSDVQMPTFSFMPQEKILSTFRKETIELYED